MLLQKKNSICIMFLHQVMAQLFGHIITCIVLAGYQLVNISICIFRNNNRTKWPRNSIANAILIFFMLKLARFNLLFYVWLCMYVCVQCVSHPSTEFELYQWIYVDISFAESEWIVIVHLDVCAQCVFTMHRESYGYMDECSASQTTLFFVYLIWK